MQTCEHELYVRSSDQTPTTMLNVNRMNYRTSNYGCNCSSSNTGHFLRGTITTGTQQAVHTVETVFKFLASLSELDGHVKGYISQETAYMRPQNVILVTARLPNFERTIRQNATACPGTFILRYAHCDQNGVRTGSRLCCVIEARPGRPSHDSWWLG